MRTTRELLYRKVQDARESCAGDSPKDVSLLLESIDEAIKFAMEVNASTDVLDKLAKAKRIIKEAKDFGDRLPADRILCEILNVDLK